MRRDGGIRPFGEQPLREPQVGGIHIRLQLIRDALRLAIRAFDQPDARAQRVHALEILLGAVAGTTAARRRRCGARASRRSRRCRASHPCSAELSMSMRTKNPHRSAAVENLPQVVDADRAIDVEAELRQLERQIALDAGPIDRFDQLQILARGGFGRRERRDALAEIVERAQQALRLDLREPPRSHRRRFRRR